MKKLLKIFLGLTGVTLIILSWTAFQIIRTGQTDQAAPADAIVVLGSAVYAGKPSPVSQARLDHALELFQKGYAPLIITTGGTYPGEKFSEGEVGKKYLSMNGIPEPSIVAEQYSQTTKQNLSRVSDIAAEKKLNRLIIVSDPFHMYRATLIAKDLNLSPLSSPTRTSPISKNTWLELKYIGREIALVLLHELFDV